VRLCHVLAFKEDKAILDAIIAPVMHTAMVTRPTPPMATAATLDMNDDVVVAERIVKIA